MDETQKFYKSKKWEAFRRVIIEQSTDADGFVRCALCGEPILKKYDLIIHHKKELSAANVNDAMISLNPDNVECVHFKCHNKLHERWQGGSISVKKQVFIVYGSPCAGKSTWVRNTATADDIIVDLDSIWQMVSINDRYQKPGTIKSVVFELRDKLYDIIKYRYGNWHNAFIITSGAMKGDRDRLVKRVGADDLIFIDTSQKECINRAKLRQNKSEEWFKYINEWFESFQPEKKEDEDPPGAL